jgi:hypothetical protein
VEAMALANAAHKHTSDESLDDPVCRVCFFLDRISDISDYLISESV